MNTPTEKIDLKVVCRAYIICLGAAGFLFGQFFFSSFEIGATLAGAAGIIVGSMGSKLSSKGGLGAVIEIGICFLGLVGVGIDALGYYTRSHAPGNSYAWSLIAPYSAALLYLSISAIKRMAAHSS